MKKRLMALICAALLVAGMTMTVSASNPSVEGALVTGIEKAVGNDNATIAVTGDNAQLVAENMPADQYATEISYIKNTDNLKKELGTSYQDGMSIIAIKNVKVVGDEKLISWPATITFKVTGIKATDKVVMLHYNVTDKAWEVIPGTTGEGTVTGTFNSLSPVVFIKTGAATSPTTGEPISLMVAGVAVLMGAAGAAVSKKRK